MAAHVERRGVAQTLPRPCRDRVQPPPGACSDHTACGITGISSRSTDASSLFSAPVMRRAAQLQMRELGAGQPAAGIDQAGEHAARIRRRATDRSPRARSAHSTRAQRHPVARRLVEARRQRDIDDRGAGLGEHLDRAVERAPAVVVEAVEVDRPADALACDAVADRRGSSRAPAAAPRSGRARRRRR